MSNKLSILEDKLFLFKITGKAEASTCGYENLEQTFYIVSTSKENAIFELGERNWGSDEIFIDEIIKLGNSKGFVNKFIFSRNSLKQIKLETDKLYSISKEIKKEFIKDGQFLRYFRDLFSELYDRLNGIKTTIPDVANLNNGKDVLYERVPESRLEFLMYLKSTIDFMIQEEKTEAEEKGISPN